MKYEHMDDCLLLAFCERPNPPSTGVHVISEMALLLWSLSANLDQLDEAVSKILLDPVGVSEQLYLLDMVDTVRSEAWNAGEFDNDEENQRARKDVDKEELMKENERADHY
jgi:hypothetical protein